MNELENLTKAGANLTEMGVNLSELGKESILTVCRRGTTGKEFFTNVKKGLKARKMLEKIGMNFPDSHYEKIFFANIDVGNDLANSILRDEVLRIIHEEQNRQAILTKAIENTKEEECSNEKIDNDWYTQFDNYAKNISDEEMQTIWAKVLSDEIKKPNSYSKRTLNVINNITKEEAEIITRIKDFIICEICVLDYPKINEKYGFSHFDRLVLEDCGFMNAIESSTIQKELIFNKKFFLLADKDFVTNVAKLTSAGIEILKLITHSENINIEYIKEIHDKLVEDNKGVKFKLHKVIEYNEEMTNYETSVDYLQVKND